MNDDRMNEATRRQLMNLVERAVRPVRANSSCKRRMREELLAHLMEVFEQELASTADRQLALERAAQRFGDPQALSCQLQQTVLLPLQWLGRYQSWLNYRPGESAFHYAGRQTLMGLMGYLVFIAGCLPVLLTRAARTPVSLSRNILFDVALVMVLFMFLFLFFSVRIAQTVYGSSSERSRRAAAGYLVFSLAIFPAMAFTTYLLLTGDLAASLAHFRLGCYFAALAPVSFWLLARQMADEIRDAQQWASLEIDG